MSLRADEPLVATMVSTLFFFSAAELAWDWVSMAIAHSSTPHGDGTTGGEDGEGRHEAHKTNLLMNLCMLCLYVVLYEFYFVLQASLCM